MRVRLTGPLMVDGQDHPAGAVVEVVDTIAADWLRQGLVQPAPSAAGVERAVLTPAGTVAPAARPIGKRPAARA